MGLWQSEKLRDDAVFTSLWESEKDYGDLDIPLQTNISTRLGTAPATFNRSTTGTVIDFEGVIHTAKINELRFPGARRVENLILSSEDLTNTSWSKIDTTVSGNQAVSPFGDLTADYVIESSGTESIQHSIRQLMSITSGITYSYSVYAKLNSIGNKRYLNLQGRPEAFGNVIAAIFDLENGTIISDEYGAGAIESIGNGWYRCSVTANAVTTYTGSNVFWIRLSNEDTKTVTSPSYIGDGVSGLTIFGVQCEEVTGTQTEHSEYVSNGALSAPYHGNGVDGVKYFTTDRSGNSLSTDGALIEPASTNRFLNSSAPVTQNITVVSGSSYTVWGTGSGSVVLSGAGSGTVTASTPVTFTASSTTLICTVTSMSSVQVELGSKTSYIPTAGTSVTRTAGDLLYNIGSVITQGQGSWLFNVRLDSLQPGTIYRLLYLSDGTNNNRIYVYANNSEKITCIGVTSGVSVISMSSNVSLTTDTTYKIMLTYEDNNVNLYINGVKVGTDTSGLIANYTYLNIGSSYGGTNQMIGLISDVKYFKEILSETQAIRITT